MKKHADSSKPNATEAAFHALLRSYGLLRQVMEPYFAPFGISGPQWGVLRVLQRAESNGETGLPLREVGQRLFIQPPSVTGVVDRLERLGLVQRTGSKADLRVRRLSLTPRGRKLMARVLTGHADQVQLLFAGLTPGELASLSGLLTKLETHLRTLTPRQLVATRSSRTNGD